MEKSKNEFYVKLIFGIGLLIFTVFVLGYTCIYSNHPQRFVIGRVIRNTGKQVFTEYFYKGVRYTLSGATRLQNSNASPREIDERYYVSFPIETGPGLNSIDHSKVPDFIKSSPSEGWTLEELQKLDKDFKPKPPCKNWLDVF